MHNNIYTNINFGGKNMFSNKFTKFLVTSLFVGLFGLVVACGGGEEELYVTSVTPEEKPAETTSSKHATKTA